MPNLKVTPEAESDLLGIWVYTCSEWGVDQADNYLGQLEVGMKQLISHPMLGTDYRHVLPGYRRLHLEHHLVFYRVERSEVIIVRVLHEDMDAPQRLLD